MTEILGELIKLSRPLETASVAEDAEVEQARVALMEKIKASVARRIPENIGKLEKKHGWAKQFDATIAAYDRWGAFGGEAEDGALMSPKEMRDGAPSIGNVIDALKERPELLAKVEQGFVEMRPVMVGQSIPALAAPMSNAIRHYKDAGKLRSTDGTELCLNHDQQVWNGDKYEGADKDGRLVYDVKAFDSDPDRHQGKTKKQILEASDFPGWQVLLLEKPPNIPREGQGQTVGGRAQVEAHRTPHEYLQMLQTEQYAHEQGLTPEAWQSVFFAHLEETEGEVLDDDNSGSACYCTGAYFPSLCDVPCTGWVRDHERACVSGVGSSDRYENVGSRFAVRVL